MCLGELEEVEVEGGGDEKLEVLNFSERFFFSSSLGNDGMLGYACSFPSQLYLHANMEAQRSL